MPAAGLARALTFAVVLAYLVGPGAQAAAAHRWFVHSVPLPAGARWAELNAVSCPSAATCTAVGDWSPRADPNFDSDPRPHIERYARGRWTLQATPAVPGGTQLKAVSCSSARACTAVGQRTTDHGIFTVAERFDGRQSTLQRTPAGGYDLLGVSCPTDRQCIAVGTTGEDPIAERWDSRRWRVQPTPPLAGREVVARAHARAGLPGQPSC